MFLLGGIFNGNSESIFYRSGDSRHLFLILDVRWKAFDLSTLTVMLAIGFSQMPYIKQSSL